LEPEDFNPLMHQMVPFVARAGVCVETMRRGYVKMVMPLQGNENHIGSIYAGALFTLGEVPGGALFFSTFDAEKYVPVVKEMNIQFIRKAETDVSVVVQLSDPEIDRIEKEAEEIGRADFRLNSHILDNRGEVVAICSGLYQLITIK